MQNIDVIVIGAGASGLLAAGIAAENNAKVLLIEKMKQPARKLLITGKGRCNITNTASISEFIKQVHPNGRFLKKAFGEYFSNDVIALFNELGVPTIEERGGRIFPKSEKAKDVADALIHWTKKLGVKSIYHSRVTKLVVEDNKINAVEITNNKGENQVYKAKSVILATGGKSYPATGSTGDGYELLQDVGHNIISPRPALVALETAGEIAKKLEGLALKNVNAVTWINGKKQQEYFGEMVFTANGLSGPIILTSSRLIVDELRNNNKVEISIDLKPSLDDNKLDIRLLRDINESGKKQMYSLLKMWLPKKLIQIFIEKIGIKTDTIANQISGKTRKQIRLLMKDFRFEITNYRPFSEAIITSGGIDTNEISAKTMKSKIYDNLFFAGELIDLDANTGGYNLQIAFSTAYVAAKNAAKIL